MTISVGDQVRVGKGSKLATVIEVLPAQDAEGGAYSMARLRGARNREFREETSRLTVVKKAGVK